MSRPAVMGGVAAALAALGILVGAPTVAPTAHLARLIPMEHGGWPEVLLAWLAHFAHFGLIALAVYAGLWGWERLRDRWGSAVIAVLLSAAVGSTIEVCGQALVAWLVSSKQIAVSGDFEPVFHALPIASMVSVPVFTGVLALTMAMGLPGAQGCRLC